MQLLSPLRAVDGNLADDYGRRRGRKAAEPCCHAAAILSARQYNPERGWSRKVLAGLRPRDMTIQGTIEPVSVTSIVSSGSP